VDKKLQIILILLISAVIFICAIQFWPIRQKPIYGVSFSSKYARELNIDPQKAFTAILSELNIKHVRFMSYWDDHEREPGKYDFSELDKQFNEASKYGAKVSLVLGLRQPRWPECHEPQWAKNLNQTERNVALQKYIDVVVEHYRGNPTLESWQLENEALNTAFGKCSDHDRERIVSEYKHLKQLDPNHPVIMSLSDQHGLPVARPVPDSYGMSIYRVFYNKLIYRGYITYPTPIWYHRLRKFVIEKLHHKPVIIHELQLEPWGPYSIPEMSASEQDKSMSVKRMKKNINFARKIGANETYFWGAEWWYWRKETLKDQKPWDIIKQEVRIE
jgi:hypothetical protein